MSAVAMRAAPRPVFGTPRQPSEPAEPTVSIPDAVARCRWIAVDICAEEFGLFVAGPALDRPRLIPRLDSAYPQTSLASKYLSGSFGEDIVRHARVSSLPRYWCASGSSHALRAMAALRYAEETTPLVPDTAGIAFPVYADRGQSGVAVFLGTGIQIDDALMCGVHARCFGLFDAVLGMRSGEGRRVPAVSKRELECLKLTANGHTSEEIAKVLKLSVHTANQYMASTAQKLNAVNRMQAVAKALRLGVID